MRRLAISAIVLLAAAAVLPQGATAQPMSYRVAPPPYGYGAPPYPYRADPAVNNYLSARYDYRLQVSPRFRRYRMWKECHTITWPGLRPECLASFDRFEPVLYRRHR